jgi:hypothetical protein
LDNIRAVRELHKEPSSSPAEPRPSATGPHPSDCPPSPSLPSPPPAPQDVAQALEPTPEVPPQPPSPTAKRTTLRCGFPTGDERRATGDPRQRPHEAALC